MVHTTTTVTLSPSAHITVNRNRVKNYGESIYLKDGTNFEIELWNPTTYKVLASINIDGKSISENGIIIKPGERVYLERWIDAPKKFKFSTYNVEDSDEAKNAISENGRVKVLFYSERLKNFFPSGSTWNGIITTGGDQPYYYNYNTIGTPNNTNLPFGGTTVNNIFTSTSFTAGNASVAGSLSTEKSIETGITSEGENSSQIFVAETGDYNTWASQTVEWKILPESMKPVEVQKIRSYCTDCGTRIRANSWKFCPACGEKL
jgi:hypothetical protein